MRQFNPTGFIAAISFVGAMLAVAAIALSSKGDGRQPEAANQGSIETNDSFIVHEWGTFTSFSGSDSVKLEFRPLVEADLPPFVLDRGRQSGILNPFAKFNLSVLQRMETPVTYFYTDRERQASVRVGFPQGLLTEFYPPVVGMEPEFKWNNPERLSGSMLDWGKIWLIPENRLQAHVSDSALANRLQARMRERLLPASGNHAHYAFARETDSALVYLERPADKQRPMVPSGAFMEKFLFYRGVGNFELPLRVAARTDGRFELTNVGAESISGLFLVTVSQSRLHFVQFDSIRAGEQLTLDQRERPSSADELGEAMVAALVDARLYEKEARAMVKTWRNSWFGEDGTRLFYLLPCKVTDKLLPLEIQPPPHEIVRVMVGRLEIMRPEDEARVTDLVRQSAQRRAVAEQRLELESKSEPHALPQAIVELGRLAEPALVRVKNIAQDEVTRREAKLLLEQLRQNRDALAVSASPLADHK